jgi:hypothetical protein
MDYTPDNIAMERKRAELVGEVFKLLDPKDAKLAESIIDRFCRMSPPLDPPMTISLITIGHGGRGGGQTRKPGNLSLNWKRLSGEFADVVINVAGAVAVPWLIPFAALSLWNKILIHATIELTKEQAASICAMWHRCDEKNKITLPKAFAEINQLFQVFKWPPLSHEAFTNILRDLEHLQCIEATGETIWLREWVQTRYE